MTRAPTPEALRTALADWLGTQPWSGPGAFADALIAGPLAPILKALADVEKERDEARAEADRRKAEREITDIRTRNQRAAIRGLRGNETAFAYWIKSRVVLTQLCRERMREVHATRAECDALKGEVERLRVALVQAESALGRAQNFITNGRELGFIRMPDPDTPDSAHMTPAIVASARQVVRAALAQEARDAR